MSMILGGPKSLSDIPILSAPEIEHLVEQVEGAMAAGAPLQAVSPIPLGSMYQMIATIRSFQTLAKGVAGLKQPLETFRAQKGETNEAPDLMGLEMSVARLVPEAQALLDAPPPEAPPLVQPGGGLITPGG